MKPFDPAYLPYLRPARRPLVGVLAGGLLVGALTIGQALALGLLLVLVVSHPSGSDPGAWRLPAIWFAGLVCARALTGYLVDVSAVRAAREVSTTLRRRLLRATLAPQAVAPGKLGEVTLLATRGMAALEPYFTRYLPSLVFAAVLPALTLAAITWLDWLSGLIVVCTIPLVPVFAALIGWATQARSDRQWRALSQLSGHFMDVVQGLPTLVAFRRAKAQSRSIRAITDRYRAATMETLKLAFASAAALELIATISVALVAVSVGVRLAAGSLDFPTAMIVLLLAPEAYWPLRRVGAEFHSAAEGVSALQQTVAILDSAASEATGSAEATASTTGRGRAGSLRLEAIGLTYPGRDEPVVDNLTAEIPPRGITAIVGPSGAGKSTLLAALLGELPVASGRIVVASDGAPAIALNTADAGTPDALLSDWRAQLAWAPQRPWLIEDSIRANLLIARPDADDAALLAALRQVELDGVLDGLPHGLDTVLGEQGAGLSAGQRARLGLARVLLADRPWVVLDEPTAHLDAATERVIVRVLRSLAQTRAVIVVAHRPEIVAAADQVISLLPAADVHTPLPLDRPAAVEDVVAERAATVPTAPAAATAVATANGSDSSYQPGGAPRGWRQLGTLLGTGSVASGVALTATASWLITRAAAQPPILTLMVAIVSVRMFGLARPTLRYAERLVSHDAALRLLAERRAEVYDALIPLVPGQLLHGTMGRRRGDLLTSVVDDVDSLVDQQLRVRQPVITSLAVGVLATGLVLLASVRAGLVIAAGLAVALLCAAAVRAVARRTESRFVAARAGLSGAVTAVVRDARHLVIWGAQEIALTAVDESATTMSAAVRRSVGAQAAARAVLLIAGGAGVLSIARWAPGDSLSAAMLALVALLPIAMVDAYLPLTDAAALSVRTARAGERVDSLLAAQPLVTDPATPAPSPEPPLTQAWVDVAAGWGSEPAFTGLSLTLAPGDKVGVVGPSGSGKSTLAAVLLRFLDPSQGAVRLNETDLRALPLDEVRRLTGLVDDDPHIFGSTVRENLRLARPEADDARLLAALHAAHLQDWLAHLPAGLDTFLGDGGQPVSGGERARLAMARTLLADQPIVVVDEPTAHLDHGTAERVAAEFLDTRAGRTIVWITHGTVGIDRLDRVMALETPAGLGQPGGPDQVVGPDQIGGHDQVSGASQSTELTPR